ncbi:hypothetical protein OIV83_000099 [Microbotryomycetes sp. JL201]|nr:hypothetical protein OIV83_000099 [Microbotryomycetes sp. JL201]
MRKPRVAPSCRVWCLQAIRPFASTSRNPRSNPASSYSTAPPTSPPQTELLTILQEIIRTHGPLPVSKYMTLCLTHPNLGYYASQKVFGRQGDFITSPEISQIFGELLAIWFVTQWAAQGRPDKVRIVELGPGRGTLLADVLRTFKALPKQSSPPVTSIHLVENSGALRAEQKSQLSAHGFGDTMTNWWGTASEVPPTEDEFTLVVAHEFFDALPIHIFEHVDKGWREVLVDVADSKAITATEPLRLVLSPGPTPASMLYTRLSSMAAVDASSDRNAPKSQSFNFDTTMPMPQAHSQEQSLSPTLSRFARLPIGSRIELSPASWEIARDLGKTMQGPRGGAGLVIDYGDSKAFGRSWRGFRKHQVVDPLSEPGHTDLTANVDFAYLSEAMSDIVTCHEPMTQASFLYALGLEPRLQGLLQKASSERKKDIESAAKRLVDPTGMGTQYKVMMLTPKGLSEPVYPNPKKTK